MARRLIFLNGRPALAAGLLAIAGAAAAADVDLGALRAAAEAGTATAQLELAVRLDAGQGVKRDRATALAWYARAAAGGQGRAQYYLGQLFETGDGVPRNATLARAWYRAAAQSVPPAAARLKDLEAHGSAALAEPRMLDLGPTAGGTLDLAWISPEQPEGTRYFLEVRDADPAAAPIDAAFRELPAVRLSLAANQRPCCARVAAVVTATGRYRTSPWLMLDAGLSQPPEPLPAEVAITYVGPDTEALAQELAGDLRHSGIRVQTGPGAATEDGHTAVRYSYDDDRAAAEAVGRMLPGAAVIPQRAPIADPVPPPGRIDLQLVAPASP